MATELNEETTMLYSMWKQAKTFHQDMGRAAGFAGNEATEMKNRLEKMESRAVELRSVEEHARKALTAIEEAARAMGINISRDWRV